MLGNQISTEISPRHLQISIRFHPNDRVSSLMLLNHAANNPTPSDNRFLLLLRSLTNLIVNSTFPELPECYDSVSSYVRGNSLQRTRFHQNGSVSLQNARESDLYRNFTKTPSDLNQISPKRQSILSHAIKPRCEQPNSQR
ncbi:hypothetical protein F511_25917 [Dorcoceras hygrometricum]|uniref:Uncharacterized protein n=1 Tax=Dorcoceras hygrometricum TaxID=472368 RepID=A0A2Z7CBD6_9LAMI|nr:hypothetical protein F511_25917 [Dorcoceras hygrometricum]